MIKIYKIILKVNIQHKNHRIVNCQKSNNKFKNKFNNRFNNKFNNNKDQRVL